MPLMLVVIHLINLSNPSSANLSNLMLDLVDASNALATNVINCYRERVDLFVGGSILKSQKGTTQGDPMTMPIYALATIPLIRELSSRTGSKEVWYTDDSAALGKISSIRQWWDTLTTCGPSFGYFPNSMKIWLIVKESFLPVAKALFSETNINITMEGHPYLGAPLGSQQYIEGFVQSRVTCGRQSFSLLLI